MTENNSDKDTKLDAFLAKHAPGAPPAPPDELSAIQRRLHRRPARSWAVKRWWGAPAAIAACLVAILWLDIPGKRSRERLETFVDESVSVVYMAELEDELATETLGWSLVLTPGEEIP